MLVVVDGGVDPLTQPVSAESFRIEFPSQVPVHIINDGKEEEKNEV
jgi:hypothetical protein